MKRFFLLLSIPLFVLLASPLAAQTTTTPTLPVPNSTEPSTLRLEKLEQLRDQLRLKQEEIGAQIRQQAEIRETVRARISEQRKERIRFFFNRLIKRFEAAISRLERLITRIESRLDRIEADNENIDTTAIREELASAKTNLESARTAIADAQTSLEDILSSNDPKEAFIAVHDLIKEIKNQLIEIHQILVHSIGEIRGLRVGTLETPTPTPTPVITPAEGEE
jgi:hypothetical protein